MDTNLLKNSIVSLQLSLPMGTASTRRIELPNLDVGGPSVINAWSQNNDDTGMVIYVHRRDDVYGIVDDYHSPVKPATELAEVAVLGHAYAIAWQNSFDYRIQDEYRRLVEQSTEMAKDEVTTFTQEYPKLIWKVMSDAWNDLKTEDVGVAHEHDYHNRITALREIAADEGITVEDAPIEEFWKLIYVISPTNKAQLVLPQDGGLTAIWKDDNGNYAHVKFLGTGKFRYVIVTAPLHESNGESVVGDCEIHDAKSLLEKHKLENLLGLYEQ